MTDVGRNELRVALDWGAQAAAGYDRLAAEVAVLRAQRDAALALCDETAQNADSALDVLAFIWLIRAALGVQPEPADD